MHASSVFLIAFFTAVFTAAGTTVVVEKMHLFPKEEPQKAEGLVPKVDGLSEDTARMQLAAQGLIMLIDGVEQSTTAEDGSVIRQGSAPGTRLPRGEVVNVTLAEAKPRVPNVVGRTVEEAGRLLEQAGFKLQLGVTKPDATVPPGQVVTQNPASGSALTKGQTITVDVSGGDDAVEVPNVVGLNFKAAKEKLEKAGFVLKTRWVTLAETQTYVALQQEPKAGSKLNKGSDVIITANRE
jgi:serine/threonine-protein kinase